MRVAGQAAGGAATTIAAGATALGALSVQGDLTMAAGAQIFIPDGTTLDPSIAFSGDPDTGIYYNAGTGISKDNSLKIAVQGSGTAVTHQFNMQAGATVTGAFTTQNARIAAPPAAQAITAAGNTITVGDADYLAPISNTTAGSITLTSTPTIADGTDGEEILLYHTGTQNVVIQDQGTLAGSNLRLTAATVTLAPRHSVRLKFDAGVGDWVQVGTLVAVL